MRDNVPDGDPSALVPPAGVAKRAGGPTGRVLIEQLRASIRALEQVPVSLATPPAPGAAPSRPACSLISSVPSDDNRDTRDSPNQDNPLATLLQGGLHEIKPQAYRDMPAGLGFILSVLAQALRNCRGFVLWCLTRAQAREWGRPYGPGLLKVGLDPAHFLVVETETSEDSAWALEEGLKSGSLAACLAQLEIKTPLAARRIGLAAQAARTPCLLLSGHDGPGVPGTLSLWRIATEGSAHVPFDKSAPGAANWRLSLERCRGGASGRRFQVEAGHESDSLRVAAAASDRKAATGGGAVRQAAG
jgi:protein ImuA